MHSHGNWADYDLSPMPSWKAEAVEPSSFIAAREDTHLKLQTMPQTHRCWQLSLPAALPLPARGASGVFAVTGPSSLPIDCNFERVRIVHPGGKRRDIGELERVSRPLGELSWH